MRHPDALGTDRAAPITMSGGFTPLREEAIDPLAGLDHSQPANVFLALIRG